MPERSFLRAGVTRSEVPRLDQDQAAFAVAHPLLGDGEDPGEVIADEAFALPGAEPNRRVAAEPEIVLDRLAANQDTRSGAAPEDEDVASLGDDVGFPIGQHRRTLPQPAAPGKAGPVRSPAADEPRVYAGARMPSFAGMEASERDVREAARIGSAMLLERIRDYAAKRHPGAGL